MTFQHIKLRNGAWKKLTLLEQLANIGSEVERAIKWKNKKNREYSRLALFRSLELIDLSLADSKNVSRLSEIARMREVLVDYLYGENTFSSDDTQFRKYFHYFTLAARSLNTR